MLLSNSYSFLGRLHRVSAYAGKEIASMLSITFKDLTIQIDSNTIALLYIIFLK